MHWNHALRIFSLTLGSAAMAAASPLIAQTPASPELVGVTGRLDHTINASSAREGQAVQIKLDRGVNAGGIKLEKGTMLVGTVTAVQPAGKGGPSSLSLDFTSAQTKDGKQIPVKVTLVGAYPSDQAMASEEGSETMGPAPRRVSNDGTFDQQPGLLHRIALHSAVQNFDSGTFSEKDGNVKLKAGTLLQLAIGPASSGGAMNSGS